MKTSASEIRAAGELARRLRGRLVVLIDGLGCFYSRGMDGSLPKITLVRHGETPWSLTGQHTGRSDPPLTDNGRKQAAALRSRLAKLKVAQVWTSPSQRARATCELAGFGELARVDDDLQECDYGRYNGLTRAEIMKEQPGWNVFEHGSPDGESVAEIIARAERVIQRIREIDNDLLIFSSGHFLRALGARWINAPLAMGERLMLDPTGVCVLGYDHSIEEPGIVTWNETFGRP